MSFSSLKLRAPPEIRSRKYSVLFTAHVLDRAERFAQNLEARISLSSAAAKPDLRTRNLETRVEARSETTLEFRARKLTRRNFSSPADPLARNPEVGSSERGVKTDTCVQRLILGRCKILFTPGWTSEVGISEAQGHGHAIWHEIPTSEIPTSEIPTSEFLALDLEAT